MNKIILTECLPKPSPSPDPFFDSDDITYHDKIKIINDIKNELLKSKNNFTYDNILEIENFMNKYQNIEKNNDIVVYNREPYYSEQIYYNARRFVWILCNYNISSHHIYFFNRIYQIIYKNSYLLTLFLKLLF